MMGDDDTTIRVKRDTWQELHRLKSPGDSMDDVLSDLIDETWEEATAK